MIFRILVAVTLGAMSIHSVADQALLRLAVTTTTDNTGLIAKLIPAFEARSGTKVRILASGSGRALRLLANGDVDIALTHAQHLELEMLGHGAAVERRPIMYNDFILLGPRHDPAAVGSAQTAAHALTRIANAGANFISRGDDSGTHEREQELWSEARIEPSGKWYRETGQGMGRTLQIASELDAYTLSDRGTWLSFGQQSPLQVLFQGDIALLNIYSVLLANPDIGLDVNHRDARALSQWLRSTEAIRLIEHHKTNGHPLFVPLLPSG